MKSTLIVRVGWRVDAAGNKKDKSGDTWRAAPKGAVGLKHGNVTPIKKTGVHTSYGARRFCL
ncbi:hypothetical protein DSLASN_38480 [Desulfoluna limicola]|uniref:Uncharacterized protein n=1 Tax=Desulfoluna limicola TaxID=2810562 RepID=A0ABN6F800_9BACT|nr:hypothetical protein DSLASN_38480 [Desulfoluna limicola]